MHTGNDKSVQCSHIIAGLYKTKDDLRLGFTDTYPTNKQKHNINNVLGILKIFKRT